MSCSTVMSEMRLTLLIDDSVDTELITSVPTTETFRSRNFTEDEVCLLQSFASSCSLSFSDQVLFFCT